jgi:hypothetical protein
MVFSPLLDNFFGSVKFLADTFFKINKLQIKLCKYACIWLFLSFISTNSLYAQENTISKTDLVQIKQKLVNLINQNRQSKGLNPVELDELAGQVGEEHCQEMLKENYFSHWNILGLKPYMRYSQANGTDLISENLSFAEGGPFYNTLTTLEGALVEMHLHMFEEEPPNDGHRQNILYPPHTHVGIGIAFNEGKVKLAEEFIDRYVEVRPLPHKIKSGESIEIVGKTLNPKEFEIVRISLFYEPNPTMLEIEELNKRKGYSLPEVETIILRPMLYGNAIYTDGSRGEFEYQKSSGKFSGIVKFSKNPKGIYTIVVWAKKIQKNNQQTEKFPVTNICVEVE